MTLLGTAAKLADSFRESAGVRDAHHSLPYTEIEELSAAGVYAASVPAEYGGADLPPSQIAEILRLLAVADPNIAQIPHSHFVYVHLLKLAGTHEQKEFFFRELLDGKRFANAQSERNTRTIAEVNTRYRDGRLDGIKYYCTGTPFAHWIPVLAQSAAGQVVIFVPADASGVQVDEDWDALGQRTTGSGTVTVDNVAVRPEWVIPRAPAFDGPTGFGAYAQLLHAAIDTGIARGALEDAVAFVQTKARPWFEAEVERAVDDPLLVQRFGELGVAVASAEATLAAAGRAVDRVVAERTDTAATEASMAVAVAKVVSDRSALEVSSALFEAGGTRSAAAGSGLDRHWRNARTHTLHDPIRWKYQHIGRSVLRGEAPPRHGLV
ncbi:SfnB family sulfur acquisition oxidoreductase [Aldersonia sp. NBC_00410]|uniref:SfnB family sulfur acquisition oxidoreductase n=1 Tax=Aldersonia sp. NBC_00410 TaxID=2975954 RepID=UPI002257DFC0|nr:SfnB family sulfur acquisition oxidoreductase [Aldersonia sp. NBC_00410]MCX5045070.1 SfnB family sulfur acquisition oxidoreductase [Aldersonia sp. NBC_00410]